MNPIRPFRRQRGRGPHDRQAVHEFSRCSRGRFLIAFGGRARYDPAFPSARPWLYGIATNLVGQRRREEAREYRLRAALGPPAEQVCHADRVAERVTAQAMTGRLAAALAGLARRDRDVLLLIAWEGLAYEEVAAALGIPVGTVRSRLNRAELIAATTARRPARRRVWSSVTVAGLAAAVAAVVVLTPAEDAGPVPEPEPVRILHAAAAKARALPDVIPRPDQFVYTKTRLADGRENETWARWTARTTDWRSSSATKPRWRAAATGSA